MTTAAQTRATAAAILLVWQAREHAKVENLIPGDAPQRPLLTDLVFGCVRHKAVLDFFIAELCPRPPAQKMRALLWVGLYQLFFMDRVPPWVALNETVAAQRKPHARKFINAVLRNADRRRDTLLTDLKQQPFATRCSHDPWLVQQWQEAFGEEDTRTITTWNNTRPGLHIRLRSGIDPVAFIAEHSFDAGPHPAFPDRMLMVKDRRPVDQLPGYAEGLFYVQDASTLYAPLLLDPQPGEQVIDACAAPGGKTIMLAELANGEGSITACEKSPERRQRLSENLARMRQSEVKVGADFFDCTESCDAVLLDVPCSNSGVIRRRPEVRWKDFPKLLEALRAEQQRLLQHAMDLARPGGRIIYSTCSILEDENRKLVAAVLAQHSDAWHITEERLILPGANHSDGGYACRIERAKI